MDKSAEEIAAKYAREASGNNFQPSDYKESWVVKAMEEYASLRLKELEENNGKEKRELAEKCWYAGVNYANDRADCVEPEDCRHPDKKQFFARLFPIDT